MKDFIHLYVIYRVDFYLMEDRRITEENAIGVVTIKSVYGSSEEAEKEVIRLNKLRDSSRSLYLWQCAKAPSSLIQPEPK